MSERDGREEPYEMGDDGEQGEGTPTGKTAITEAELDAVADMISLMPQTD